MRMFFSAAVLALGVANIAWSASFEAGVFRVDTAVYEYPSFMYQIFISPDELHAHITRELPDQSSIMLQAWVYRKKNTEKYDILSYSGKVGSFIIPASYLVDIQDCNPQVLISRTFIDADDGWEYIINNNCGIDNHFTVNDEDGSLLLSDSSTADYGFDGKNTYILQQPTFNAGPDKKYWRCRTNITAAATPALAKSATSAPLPMMTYGSSGNYRIAFVPSGGGMTTVQLFDLLGKQIFAKTIGNTTRPMSFTIPESDIPRTPFVAKVSNEHSSTVRREIPVR